MSERVREIDTERERERERVSGYLFSGVAACNDANGEQGTYVIE